MGLEPADPRPSGRKRAFYGEVSELAEGARLEIVWVLKRCLGGSNPPLSAINKLLLLLML